jgi:hypothetical protein
MSVVMDREGGNSWQSGATELHWTVYGNPTSGGAALVGGASIHYFIIGQ